MHTEEALEEIQQVMGWANIIEGTLEGTIVAINDTVLTKVFYRDTPPKQIEGVAKIKVQPTKREYIVLTEIERVTVTNTNRPQIRIFLKTGTEAGFEVSENEHVEAAIQSILFHIGKAKSL